MALPGGHIGAGGVWTPTQAESVVITTTDSYAILESVETIKQRMAQVEMSSAHEPVFIVVSPKEGGTAMLNIAHIIGFVSQGEEAETG